MPLFRPRNRIEILRDMVARVVARSKLVGLFRSAGTFHILAAAADEDAEQYFQIARLRDLFSIDRATGSDLDERMAEIQPGLIKRLDALYASTVVTFSRPGTTGTLSYPAGAVVAASDANGPINFRTTGTITINNGSSTSAPVNVVCSVPGTRGNVAQNSITRFVTRLPGITGVTNPSDVVNGVDREKDPPFRARGKAFVRSLSRGTIVALETGAKNARLSDGSRVLFSAVVEDAFRLGIVSIYIDDGTGGTDTYDSSFVGSPETVLASAIGGERRVFTTNKPIRDDGSWKVRLNGSLLTRNTDYVVNLASGQVSFSPSVFPTGLTAGDEVTIEYRSYTRLIREAQRIIDGDPTNQAVYPGVRAGGTYVRVLPPAVIAQTLVGGIVVADGFDASDVAQKVEAAIVDYINNLNIGDDVILAEIIQRAMDVEGMEDILITSLSGSTPPTNQVIAEYQVARISSADISLT